MIVVAPLEHTGREYQTDEGVIVPSISVQLRNKLIKISGEFADVFYSQIVGQVWTHVAGS